MEAPEQAAVEVLSAGRRLARPPSLPVVVEESPLPTAPVVVEPESVEALREQFQREYYALLLKPAVKTAVERALRKKKNPRDAIEMFKAVVSGLAPGEAKQSVHARSITVISRLARPAKVKEA